MAKPALPTILIAEDNEPMLLAIKAVLQQEGYNLIEAMDGTTALLLANEKMPDLVLLDLYLPGMSGIELAKHFQGWMPFLVITVDRDDKNIQTCLDRGALNYILKPIKDEDLRIQVRAGLARGQEYQNLRRGIEEIQITSKACGLLMSHFDLTETAAREMLCAKASAQRRRAADLAAKLVEAFDVINTFRPSQRVIAKRFQCDT